MAKKSFLNKARQTFSESDVVVEERATNTRRGEIEGTTRLKEARNIPIGKIKPDQNQPRKSFDGEALKELAASIGLHGILQPIVVEYVEQDDYFKIISGERRYRAALLVELTHLPCVIRSTNTEERLTLQLIENIQREDLSPVDKARGLLQLKATLGKDTLWKKVEEITGFGERRRQQLLALLDLPEDLQNKIVSLGKKPAKNLITEKHARALLRLNRHPEKQVDLFNRITSSKESITGDRALQVVKEMFGAVSEKAYKISFTYATTRDLIKQLEEKLAELKKPT